MTIRIAPTFSFCVFQHFPTQPIINLMGKRKKKKSLHTYASFSEICISKEKIHPVQGCAIR